MSVFVPFAEDLTPGVTLPLSPDVTIDEGLAAQYAAITGDGLRPALSSALSATVTGRPERLANPALVLSVSIGQSTVATRRVIANLQYRNVAFLRQVHLGETIRTTVTPLAADWTRSGRERAKVLLGMRLATPAGEVIADYERLALLPVREPDRLVATEIPEALPAEPLAGFARLIPGAWSSPSALEGEPSPGLEWADPLADTVSSARELVRLTHNLAATHRDGRIAANGQRLVYGGHTIGLAQASLARTMPDLVTVLAWRSCDHVGPVFEEDLLTFHTRVDAVERAGEFLIADLTVRARAHRGGADPIDVLDFKPVVLIAGGRA